MKHFKKIFTKILTLTFLLSVYLPDTLQAQQCPAYYYTTRNAEVHITSYDAKGIKNGLNVLKVMQVVKDKNSIRSTVNSVVMDKTGKEVAKGRGTIKCQGERLMVDMRMLLPPDQLRKDDVNASLSESFTEYPSLLTIGMQLPDAKFNMESTSNGMASEMVFEMKNREVVAKEKITSTGGSWEAYKITYNVQLKIKLAGIGLPVNLKVSEWFVVGFGIVKSETYSKKGKLLGSTIITKHI